MPSTTASPLLPRTRKVYRLVFMASLFLAACSATGTQPHNDSQASAMQTSSPQKDQNSKASTPPKPPSNNPRLDSAPTTETPQTTETPPSSEQKDVKPRPTSFEQTGIASWYGGKFHGRKTASGERFDKNAMTAAHRTLRFGTWVEVENIRNGKTVQVRINDRGPFTKGRVIDLSQAAGQKVGISGTAQVRLRQIPAPE